MIGGEKIEENLKIGTVFTHRPSNEATWPYKGYDYESRKKELMEKLRNEHPDVAFDVFSAKNTEEAEEILARKEEFDAFLVYMVGLSWKGISSKIAGSGKPTLLVDDLYAGSGDFLTTYSAAKEGGKVAGTASSDFKDVKNLVNLLKVIKRMGGSKILVVKQEEPTVGFWAESAITERSFEEYSSEIKEMFGIEVVQMSPEKIKEYRKESSEEEAEGLAKAWGKNAEKIEEPSHKDLIDSASLYLALKKAMEEVSADAVTIDCLDLHYNEVLTGYPCLAYFQLNNDGSAGICEADLNSSVTQLMGQYMIEEITGEPRPGFVSDPVIDLNTDQIIYAHCVAPNKVFGPSGQENPYVIRSHAEDDEGASVQSLMPVGEDVTTMIVDVMNGTMRIHGGKSAGNVQEEKACRTKLSVDANADNILENWKKSGWHRVTFYGDWKDYLEKLALLLGLEVIEEDR